MRGPEICEHQLEAAVTVIYPRVFKCERAESWTVDGKEMDKTQGLHVHPQRTQGNQDFISIFNLKAFRKMWKQIWACP